MKKMTLLEKKMMMMMKKGEYNYLYKQNSKLLLYFKL